MALKTVAQYRFRTDVKTFQSGSLVTLETAYAAWSSALYLNTTRTYSCRVVTSYLDGSNYVLIAESSYPEFNEDPTGQVPLLP